MKGLVPQLTSMVLGKTSVSTPQSLSHSNIGWEMMVRVLQAARAPETASVVPTETMVLCLSGRTQQKAEMIQALRGAGAGARRRRMSGTQTS